MTSAGNSLRTSADVFLRTIPMGRWITTTEDAVERSSSPRFTVPSASGYGRRALPIVVIFLMGVHVACAGWIRPDRQLFDWQVNPTYAPVHFTNTTASLYGFLQGIDQSLALKATLDQLAGPQPYLPLSGGTVTGSLMVDAGDSVASTNRVHFLRTSAGADTEVWHIEFTRHEIPDDSVGAVRIIFRDSSGTQSHLQYATNHLTSSATFAAPVVKGGSFVFPEGDYLHGDGINLFYTSADGQTTTRITDNEP